ncbi:hypothetical protein [Hymenobacter actinosclerus]|uniref:Uncharacterized protein n=1 Tax=Hymenobacter actinosclerus TaxID=82805 RepID=A0A1I0B6D7_9BACT|nr:hypothetical protein [Hymenobacter actinosclerus]SET02258.1 hypothetical protein SAMN04487998_0952 [Hymenobacter actinosclerus]
MKWLPSFVRLFMLFVLGLLLTFFGTMGFMNNLGGESSTLYSFARIFGLVLVVVSPILIGLKFFSRLDQKS